MACSVITTGELYAGARSHEMSQTSSLLAGFDQLPVTAQIARSAGLLKNEWASRGFKLTLEDMIIAATAIVHERVLISENRKDFPMPELVVLDLPGQPF